MQPFHAYRAFGVFTSVVPLSCALLSGSVSVFLCFVLTALWASFSLLYLRAVPLSSALWALSPFTLWAFHPLCECLLLLLCELHPLTSWRSYPSRSVSLLSFSLPSFLIYPNIVPIMFPRNPNVPHFSSSAAKRTVRNSYKVRNLHCFLLTTLSITIQSSPGVTLCISVFHVWK